MLSRNLQDLEHAISFLGRSAQEDLSQACEMLAAAAEKAASAQGNEPMRERLRGLARRWRDYADLAADPIGHID